MGAEDKPQNQAGLGVNPGLVIIPVALNIASAPRASVFLSLQWERWYPCVVL